MPDLNDSEFMIVTASAEHVETIAPLFDAYRVFYKRPSDLNGARRFLTDRLQNREAIIYLAVRKDNRRGLGFTQLYPSFSSISMRKTWLLNDLFVIPSGRRHGIAKALIECAVQLTVDTGARGLELATTVDNIPAQRLFESLGWQRDEEFQHYYLRV